MEGMDLEHDEAGEQQGPASSSSSEGDLELPIASGPSSQSPSRSRTQPPKPAPPRQRPTIPPRPKETTAATSEGQMEPTPFDLPVSDPFQDLEKAAESLGPDQGKKPQPPVLAPKPVRPSRIKKPQQTFDASTLSTSDRSSPAPLTKVSIPTHVLHLFD